MLEKLFIRFLKRKGYVVFHEQAFKYFEREADSDIRDLRAWVPLLRKNEEEVNRALLTGYINGTVVRLETEFAGFIQEEL